MLVKGFSHNRLRNGTNSIVAIPAFGRQDAVHFRAERWSDADGCSRLEAGGPEATALGGSAVPAAPRPGSRRPGGVPVPCSADVPPAGPPHDAGHGAPALDRRVPSVNGESSGTHLLGRWRGPGTRTQGRRHRPCPRPPRPHSLLRLGPAPSSAPAARCPQSPPSPQHSHEQLEDPREDQVVAGDGPPPAEEHHPRHGEEPAARARAGSPRASCHPEPSALRSPPPNRDSAQAHAGAGVCVGGRGWGERVRDRDRRTRTGPHAAAAGPLRLRRCADPEDTGGSPRVFAGVKSVLLFSFCR